MAVVIILITLCADICLSYPYVCLMQSRHFFIFKQKTAYEMRISDWSSDVCSSALPALHSRPAISLLRHGDGKSRLRDARCGDGLSRAGLRPGGQPSQHRE